MTEPPDVRSLKAAIDAAVEASRSPPYPGAESWPFTFPDEHLSANERRLAWSVVRHIRREHRDVYRQFLRERTIYDFIIDFVAMAESPTLESVVADLRTRAREERTWLVDVPLLNVVLPREALPLGDGVMLVRARREKTLKRDAWPKDPWEIRRHFGDELPRRARWLHAGRRDEVDVDTRVGASLLLVQEGVEELAIDVAESSARFALAMWCLLSPPRSAYDPAQPWPVVGGWTPGEFVELGVLRKRYEPHYPLRKRRARVRGNSVTVHAEARLTRSETYLRAPFDAMEKARRGSVCARALLSAAHALYLAEHVPNQFVRTERVLHTWKAKEALSDPGPRGERSEDRWNRLVVNLGIRSDLGQLGYERDEIDEAFRLVELLRNLATHRPDDVLVNLSWPEGVKTHLHGGHVVDADRAALAFVAADWPIVRMAVHLAARRLTKGAINNEWDDGWFHSRFSGRR